ncbi:Scarecrow-like protein 8 [Striga hermonthica]|uniref:Scarecrow-like protein 8 n=1 Tax=Striga hermonthica TaxID=68872 RepID=A0A9N7RIM6_STRHE|nr:Scarecrow-like protein 8 [Striga hermonthica]
MNSGFPGGFPDFFSSGRALPSTMSGGAFNANLNSQQQFSFRSPLAGLPPDRTAQIRRPDFIGKRSLAEFQQQNQGLGFYPRNVKQRPAGSYPEMFSGNPRYGLSILNHHRLQPLSILNRNGGNNGSVGAPNQIPGPNMRLGASSSSSGSGQEESARDQSEKSLMMSHKLQELEKQLLGDDDDSDTVASAVTDSKWSDAIQGLIGPDRKPISPSPTSSSSSCSSTSASPPLPCAKQALVDAAAAISDGRPEAAAEMLARILQQVANTRGTPEQRLAAYMAAALMPRVGPARPAPETHGKEHAAAAQMLYDASPPFKLGFMAANLAILEATAEQGLGRRIHVVDFDIGQGGQYVHLLHALAAKVKAAEPPMRDGASLKITAVEGLGRRMVNAVACEGRDRVERCEVFGKWRARMGMAGFQPRQVSQLVVESLKAKVNSGTRGNPGFTVNEESGGVAFGWKGRNLTVASAWR